MSYNNPEFQAYLETIEHSNEHRKLLWDIWVEATKVAEVKSKARNEQKSKCSCGRKLFITKGVCTVCDNDE